MGMRPPRPVCRCVKFTLCQLRQNGAFETRLLMFIKANSLFGVLSVPRVQSRDRLDIITSFARFQPRALKVGDRIETVKDVITSRAIKNSFSLMLIAIFDQ